MNTGWTARWILDERFEPLTTRNVFRKQRDPDQLPAHRPDLQNLHTLFRKTFTLSGTINSAILKITADDYYKLWLNGHFVGQGPAPAYFDHYFYNQYDVSEYLVPGDNVIAAHVYYQGLINRVWNSGDYRQGLCAELFVNEALLVKTDASWRYATAREFTGADVIGYDTQYLEPIDNRLKQVGWHTAAFDDRAWKPACEHQRDDHVLIAQPTPPVAVYAVRPQRVQSFDDGRHVIDFGHEITGHFTMQASGQAGQVIDIRCGEELADGAPPRVRFAMRCNCEYREAWTLSGRVDELEHYDYKAFRYVEVCAPADVVIAPDSFGAVVRHYPFDDTACAFQSGSPVLNAIWEICKNGVKYGTQELYLDCPSREKGQYLGDALITAQAHAYLTGDLRLWQKALADFARSARVCPGLMAVAPGSLMQEIADFALIWPLLLCAYYEHSGALDFLQAMYPVAEAMAAYFRGYQRADGLLENVRDKWNLVDWPANLRDGYDFDVSQEGVGAGCHNVINAYYCGAVATLNHIRDILKIPYEDTFPALKQAFITAFYNPATRLFVDSTVSTHSALHANTIALFYGLVPDDAVASVVALIRQKRLNCGVYHAYFLLKGLARVGEYELVYELLASDDEHSWANMLREGATTCFEVWGKDQKWNTSLCHPWASSPILIIIEDLLGLSPGAPGWAAPTCAPHLPVAAQPCTLSIPTIRGLIRVRCENGRTSISSPTPPFRDRVLAAEPSKSPPARGSCW